MALMPWSRALFNPIRRPSLRMRVSRRGSLQRLLCAHTPTRRLGGCAPAAVDTDAPVTRELVSTLERPGLTIRVYR